MAIPSRSGTAALLANDEQQFLQTVGREPRRNRDDLVTLIVATAIGTPRSASEWQKAVSSARREWFPVAERVCADLSKILLLAAEIGELLGKTPDTFAESIADASDHFDVLLMPGWLLRGRLPKRLVDFRGLQMRLTRMLGSAPAKDLAKLERHRAAAAAIWNTEATCECGECFPSATRDEQLEQDFDLRLQAFAPELRARA